MALSIVTFLVAMDSLHSQTYTLEPGDTLSKTGRWEDLETLSIKQTNITQGEIQLKWLKVSESVPANWEATVCDNVNCYTSLVDSGTMNPISPADFGFILLHITPKQYYGTAVIRYAVWDVMTPSQRDTLTFILTAETLTGLTELKTNFIMQTYPNPVSDQLNIAFEDNQYHSIALIQANGTLAYRSLCQQHCSIPVAHIPSGLYILTAISDQKTIATQKLFIQK